MHPEPQCFVPIMSVKELCETLNFSNPPTDTGDFGRWQKIEDDLGISLPDDYKEFINVFGTVQIGDFIYVLSPFTENPHLNLKEQVFEILEGFRSLGSFFGGEKYTHPLYPDKGGLLPWGFSINGDHLFWLTQGEPRDWRIAVDESRGASFETYNQSMSGFLSKLLRKEIRSEILGDNLNAICENVS
jgi:hypothetical protein